MTADEWKKAWPSGHLSETVDRPELPPLARDFLRTCGLPKVMVFEAIGDDGSMAFEWRFKSLSQPLLPYSKLIRWGAFYSAEQDRLWSRQLEIGNENFCNGSASICVHDSDEYVVRLDCEISGIWEFGMFINASLPQFGECMLAATRLAAKFNQAEKERRRELFSEMIDALARIDPAAKEGARGLSPFWPNILDGLEPDVGIASFEITSDPERSKPRF
jgi:hypothetical protein